MNFRVQRWKAHSSSPISMAWRVRTRATTSRKTSKMSTLPVDQALICMRARREELKPHDSGVPQSFAA